MKHLCVNYVLRTMISKPSDWPCIYQTSFESINISVTDELAEVLLNGVPVPTYFYNWLQLLAQIQGYENADFKSAVERLE